MGNQRGITMAAAAMFQFRDGVKASAREHSGREQIYVDDGRQITTTFARFCLEIGNNTALFQPRSTNGKEILPAYSFNLVSGIQSATEILATVEPLTSTDVSSLSFNVFKKSAPDLTNILKMGEPVILKRYEVPFALMCPAAKYVWSKIQSDVLSELKLDL